MVTICRLLLLAGMSALVGCGALSREPDPDTDAPSPADQPTATFQLPDRPVVLPPPIGTLEVTEAGQLRLAEPDTGVAVEEDFMQSLANESGESEADLDEEVGADVEVTDRYTSAIAAMRAGNDAEAKALFVEMTQDFPEFSGPFVNLGIIHFRAEDYDQAREAFEKALQLNPDSAISYNHLGILSRRDGDFNQALEHYTNALAVKQNYANAHLNLGILLELYLGQLEDALGHYRRYYRLTGEQDEEVRRWIIDLERRLERN